MFFYPLWKADSLKEGERIVIEGKRFLFHKSILRQEECWNDNQAQTGNAYEFMWSHQEVMGSDSVRAWFKHIMEETFPTFDEIAARHLVKGACVLDAGCGAGNHILHKISGYMPRLHYLGVEISGAVDRAKENFSKAGFPEAEFVQGDLNQLPVIKPVFDFVFCAGVLHHTPSVAQSIQNLSKVLKPGGGFLIWVYRDVPPLRQLSDDYIRKTLRGMPGPKMLEALTPLTELACAFGELKATIDIKSDIPMLGIKAGRYDVQRFLNYHLLKMFYNSELPFERMNLYTYDWYAPDYAHTHTPDELQGFFKKAGLTIDYRFEPTPTGVTIYAVKQ